jgi:hypothetical protein
MIAANYGVIKMKSTKLIMLTVFIMIVGCLAPIVSAKPITIVIKAVGQGTATYNGKVYPAKIGLIATVEPIGETGDYAGTADIVMKFVLPDGTKITAFKDLPVHMDVNDNELIPCSIEITLESGDLIKMDVRRKPRTVGTLNEVITTKNGLEISLDFDLRFSVQIDGVEAGH